MLTLLCCIVIGFTAGGSAWAYTFDMGSGSTIDTSGTNGVLRLDVVEDEPQPGQHRL